MDPRSEYNKLSLKRLALLREVKQLRKEMINIAERNKLFSAISLTYWYHDKDKLPDFLYHFDVNYLLGIPDDVFKQNLMEYLAIKDIGQLDIAMTNHNIRYQYLNKIANSVLLSSKVYTKINRIEDILWLSKRKLHLPEMMIDITYLSEINIIQQVVQKCKKLTFHHVENLESSTLGLIVSNCKPLNSLNLISFESVSTLQLIDNFSQYCKGLQYLDLTGYEITDICLISISKNCTDLKVLFLSYCEETVNAGIISIAQHCIHLKEISLRSSKITNECLIILSRYCTELETLDLSDSCQTITDVGIIQLSEHCTALKSLSLNNCNELSDAGVISLAQSCSRLEYLNLHSCINLTDTSALAIARGSLSLRYLNFRYCDNISIQLRSSFQSLHYLRSAIDSVEQL